MPRGSALVVRNIAEMPVRLRVSNPASRRRLRESVWRLNLIPRQIFERPCANAAIRPAATSAFHMNINSIEADPIGSARSNLFDTSSWGEFCDVTLTLRQGRQAEGSGWMKIDHYQCRQAFRHFMNLLNKAVYPYAFRRHGKRLRVLPVLEKGEVRARSLRRWERGTSGRWHIHCAIELPPHFNAFALRDFNR